MTRKQKQIGLLVIGIVLAILGAVGIWTVTHPKAETKENILCTYEAKVDMPYRVRIFANELYEGQWQESDGVYAWKLTDYIEVTPSMELTWSQVAEAAYVEGAGQIWAVVEGYQTSGDTRKPVYERRTLLGEMSLDSQTGLAERTLRVNPNDFLTQAERAEQVIGISTPKDSYLLFEGNYRIELGDKVEEKPFSMRISIPLGTGEGLYEITKDEEILEEGTIEETVTQEGTISVVKLILCVLLLIVGCGIGYAAWFLVVPADELELWKEKMQKILRQYGSHMVCVESVAEKMPVSTAAGSTATGSTAAETAAATETENAGAMVRARVLHVADIDSLSMVSEELRSPIIYSRDEEGLPTDGNFTVFGDNVSYQLSIPKPITPPITPPTTTQAATESTTKVVEKRGPEGDSIS